MIALADMTDCELIYQGAVNIMELRNREVPLDEMLRSFRNGNLQAITLRAYNHPTGLWTPVEFANDEMAACLTHRH